MNTLLALCLLAVPASAVTIDMVTVGNPGNANDTTGYGAVNYEYRIGKYEVTIQQYTAFLNAVDPNGTNPNGIYNSTNATYASVKGIAFSSVAPSGSKYSALGGASRPVTFVSWFDAARFANWMQNGQGSGSTETGAYTLVGGQTSGTAPSKNPGATFYIPTENEWYKAAYYSPLLNSGSGGFYTFATQSNGIPGNTVDSGSNQVNYINGVYSVTQSPTFSSTQNYLTDVGAFTASDSFYGTFDQSGNVYEWNDLTGSASSSRGLRGGSWSDLANFCRSASRNWGVPGGSYDFGGFRLVLPAVR